MGLQEFKFPEAVEGAASGERAFLTGSHVYGRPRDDSDVDLVVLVSHADLKTLAKLLGGEVESTQEEDEPTRYPAGSLSIKDGRLNLIATSDPDRYEAWREGTKQLKARAPVDRAEAVELLKRLGVSS